MHKCINDANGFEIMQSSFHQSISCYYSNAHIYTVLHTLLPFVCSHCLTMNSSKQFELLHAVPNIPVDDYVVMLANINASLHNYIYLCYN